MLTAIIDAGYRFAYRLAYGGMKVYWRACKPQTRGTAVAIWRGDELLFVRNSYRRGLSFPGGGVGRTEHARDAARRELSEEVGVLCTTEELREAFTQSWVVDAKRDTVTLFELHRHQGCDVIIDNREIVAAHWLSVDEALSSPIGRVARRYLKEHLRAKQGEPQLRVTLRSKGPALDKAKESTATI